MRDVGWRRLAALFAGLGVDVAVLVVFLAAGAAIGVAGFAIFGAAVFFAVLLILVLALFVVLLVTTIGHVRSRQAELERELDDETGP